MKKQFLTTIALILCFGFSSSAQMVLEHHYVASGVAGIVNLSLSGRKIAMFDTTTKQLKIYNMDNSLWKTINFPNVPGFTHYSYEPGYMIWGGAEYISETLFHTDNLIEFTTWYWSTTNPGEGQRLVLNENGNIINSFQNNFYIYNAGNNKFKALVHKGYSNYDYDVYTLPGTIPCDPCASGLGLKESTSLSGGGLSDPAPNPTGGLTTIQYQLPDGIYEGELALFNTNGQEIRKYRVGHNFRHITLDNSELASGTYYYQLRCNGAVSGAKKMIVIK